MTTWPTNGSNVDTWDVALKAYLDAWLDSSGGVIVNVDSSTGRETLFKGTVSDAGSTSVFAITNATSTAAQFAPAAVGRTALTSAAGMLLSGACNHSVDKGSSIPGLQFQSRIADGPDLANPTYDGALVVRPAVRFLNYGTTLYQIDAFGNWGIGVVPDGSYRFHLHGGQKTSTTVFTGTGLDDCDTAQIYTGTDTGTVTFDVEIDGTGTPDTFKWRKNAGAWTTGVPITINTYGGPTKHSLSDGVTVRFTATTGHTSGDKWTITCTPADLVCIEDIAGTDQVVIDKSGNATFTQPVQAKRFASPCTTVTIAAAATTFAVTSNVVKVTGDAGGNTVATITGGVSGQILTLIFVDALVTITDDNSKTANTVNLSAAFTSAANTTLSLVFDGTSWYETSRSVNG